jgi:hypothetical protein
VAPLKCSTSFEWSRLSCPVDFWETEKGARYGTVTLLLKVNGVKGAAWHWDTSDIWSTDPNRILVLDPAHLSSNISNTDVNR